MAFKLKFQGKSKELYGSVNTMVRKGLVTPAYLMEGPGDEVKVSSSSGSSKSGRKLTDAELAAKQRELQKLANETGKSQSFENKYGQGGQAEEVWKTLSDEQKARFGTVENFRKETDAYNKMMSQRLSADPEPKENKPKPKPQQDAKPSADQIGTELYNRIYSQVRDKRVYDPELGYKRPKTKEEILREGPAELVAQYRNATKAKTDDTVVIGSTGDADRIKNVVTDQLEQKTMSNALDPATIIKGAMMVKNLIGKKKEK